MDKNELSKKTKDELIDIILELEESAWYGMAIAQDIANAKSIVDKKYKRLICLFLLMGYVKIIQLM